MIRLKKENSWHYRRYQRWETWKRRTAHRYEPRETLDLCHYTRVVLLWYSARWPFQRYFLGVPPIIWFLGAAVLSGAGLGVANVRDWVAVAVFAGIVAGLVVLVLAVMLGSIYLFAEKEVGKKAVGSIRESETLQLGWEFAKAKKRRVCPLIQRPEGEEKW